MNCLPVIILLARLIATATIDPPTSIPKIAKIAGVLIGFNTTGELEQKIGRGLIHVGGHPNSGRYWRVRGKNWAIYTDGFEYARRKRTLDPVIDGFSIGGVVQAQAKNEGIEQIPIARASRKALRFLGLVEIGMSRRQVLQRLKGKLPKPKSHEGSLIWSERGFVRLNAGVTFRLWEAVLSFDGGRLSQIQIDCE